MVAVDTWVFLFSLVDGTCLLFLTVYFIITLSDLECDYLNARICCERLNKWVIPEIVAHTLMILTQLFTWHPLIVLFNAPLACWHIYRLYKKPAGYIGFYDPTEIHNRQNLKFYMKECMVKLATHLVFFFIYLYSMISLLVYTAGDYIQENLHDE